MILLISGSLYVERLFLHFRGGKIAQARCHWQRCNTHTLRTHLTDNFCRRTRTVLHLISTSRYSLLSQYSPTSSTSVCMALQAVEAIPSPYHETSLPANDSRAKEKRRRMPLDVTVKRMSNRDLTKIIPLMAVRGVCRHQTQHSVKIKTLLLPASFFTSST